MKRIKFMSTILAVLMLLTLMPMVAGASSTEAQADLDAIAIPAVILGGYELPTAGTANGSAISWSADKLGVIDNNTIQAGAADKAVTLLALCLLLAMIPYSAFAALDMIKETDIAKKAIRQQEKQTTLSNDITMDEILSIVKKLIPEDCPVTLSFSKESDLRVYNATTEKAGSVFANFAFTCEGYTTHDMYTFAIPVMTDELSPH